ncbi:Doxorubicin resistance ATP-binding protein DrrA [Corynebacterium lowii]|uniref:Doxorubicin resistance ATP-binding protein DrrA n=1 Tax=Corynebacterium lowii TaxID=1544413 RepID=A0A0Q0U2H1_9CORY|nr:Doxorubicin resistance ATP-binding protein DrrA [Corynebacterium lowii]
MTFVMRVYYFFFYLWLCASRSIETMPIIEVNGLTRRYKDTKNKSTYTAVDNLSFHVERGEVFGLLGTNGAGKTSSLEVMEGLAEPDEGSVRIYELDPCRERERLRPELGIMLQSGGLPSQLTVEETLRMWAGTLSTPLPIEEVAEAVELTHRMNVKVGALSGGEQRRLDLGCALAGNPSVVFLDEPTTGLDPENRRHTWELLRSLKERGVTMVLTTHYLEEAEFLCDRLAIMHQSRIVREGTVSELVGQENASLTFTTGHPVPNIFSGTRHHDGHRYTVHTRHLQADTYALLDWAARQQIELRDFRAQPASLETVFMNIAGSTTQV